MQEDDLGIEHLNLEALDDNLNTGVQKEEHQKYKEDDGTRPEFDAMGRKMRRLKAEKPGTYDMRLRRMTQSSRERYTQLRDAGHIAETNFSMWVDKLILRELAQMEAFANIYKAVK